MIIGIILLIFVWFLFWGSETGLRGVNGSKFESEGKKGDGKGEGLRKLLDKGSEFMSSILMGKNVGNIILGRVVRMLGIDIGVNVGIGWGIVRIVIIVFYLHSSQSYRFIFDSISQYHHQF